MNPGSSLIPTNTGVFSSSTGSAGNIQVWLNYGECDIDQCITELTVSGPAPLIAVYNTLSQAGSKGLMKVQQSSTKLTIDEATANALNRVSIYRNESGTLNVIGHRSELFVNSEFGNVNPLPNPPALLMLLQAVGGGSSAFSWSNLSFGPGLNPATLAYAEGIHTVTGSPVVGAYGTQFLTGRPDVDFLAGDVPVPPFVGTFAKLEYTGVDQAGSIATSGGIALATKKVRHSYDVKYDDSTILALPCSHRHKHLTVSLPRPSLLARIAISEGKIIIVKNGAKKGKGKGKGSQGARGDGVRVVGKVADGEVVLGPGQAATFQIVGREWQIIARA